MNIRCEEVSISLQTCDVNYMLYNHVLDLFWRHHFSLVSTVDGRSEEEITKLYNR